MAEPRGTTPGVAQIIDYATAISQWTYERLDAAVRSYDERRGGNRAGLFESVKDMDDIGEGHEPTLVDTVSRNLRSGKFLLMIVGDGIRESVEAMVAYLGQTPQLHFTLALVELQVYKLERGLRPLLVVPQVVARTREVARAVVYVEARDVESVRVEVPTETKGPDGPPRPPRITEEAFYDDLRRNTSKDDVEFVQQFLKDVEEFGCEIEWKQASFVVKLRDPGESGRKLSLLVVPRDGATYLREELREQLRSVGLPARIATDYARASAALFDGIAVTERGTWSNPIALGRLRQQYAGFLSVIQKAVDSIRNAAREG